MFHIRQSPVIPATCLLLYAAIGTSCQCRGETQRSGVKQTRAVAESARAQALANGHRRDHPHIPTAVQPAMPAPGLAGVSLVRHVQRTTAIRITRLQEAGPESALRLDMWSLTDRRDVGAMLAAVGVDQQALESPCIPCPGATRIVFEGPMGLHLAEVQTDCPAGEKPDGDGNKGLARIHHHGGVARSAGIEEDCENARSRTPQTGNTPSRNGEDVFREVSDRCTRSRRRGDGSGLENKAQVRLGAHPVCGQLSMRDPVAVDRLIAKARTDGRSSSPLAMP